MATAEMEELKKIRSRLGWLIFLVGIPLWISISLVLMAIFFYMVGLSTI